MKSKAITTMILFLATIFTLAFSVAPVAATQPGGIVGLWHLDKKFGTALDLDGVDDYVSAPYSFNAKSTVEMWIKMPFAGDADYGLDYRYLLRIYGANDDGWLLRLNNASKEVYFGYYDRSNLTWYSLTYDISSWSANTWHHIAVTWDVETDELNLYVDGVLRDTDSTWTIVPHVSDTALSIGVEHNEAAWFWMGTMDEVRISDVARTSFDLTGPITADDNTVALWHFDEESGVMAYDETSNDNHGSIDGATWVDTTLAPDTSTNNNFGTLYNFEAPQGWVDGKFGNALEFDSNDDYVEVPNSPSLSVTNAITIGAWVYMTSAPTNMRVVCKPYSISAWNPPYADYELVILNEGGHGGYPGRAVYFGLNLGGTYTYLATSLNIVPLDAWTHLAATYEGSSMKIYINGIERASDPVSGTIGTSGNPLFIGTRTPAPNEVFDGIIDEVRIYNEALRAEEIAALASPTCVEPPDDLVSWWPGDGNANDIVDGNDGSLENGATFGAGKVGQAFSFDGVDDYVNIGYMGSFPAKGTIEFWMKADAVQNYRNPFTTNYIGGNAGIRFEEHSSYSGYTNAFYAVVGNDAGNYGGHVFRYTASESPYNNPMQANTWYHVALVWDTTANNVKGYWDGVKAFDVSHSFWPTMLPDVAIGNGFSASRYWDGLVDEVVIYNRALTADEIQAIYNAGSEGKCKVAPLELVVEKAKVAWHRNEIEIRGNLHFPEGIWMDTLSPVGSAVITLAEVEVTDQSVEFEIKGKNDDKWEYKDKENLFGPIKEFKIDWKGAKFDYKGDDGFHIHTHFIGASETTLCIHTGDVSGAFTVTIDETDISYDADRIITTDVEYESQKDDNSHVHFTLPFQLTSDMTVDVSGAVNLTIPVADYSKEFVAKFKVKSIFDPAAVPDGSATVPDELEYEISLGDPPVMGSDLIGGDKAWTKKDDKHWEYKYK